MTCLFEATTTLKNAADEVRPHPKRRHRGGRRFDGSIRQARELAQAWRVHFLRLTDKEANYDRAYFTSS